MRHTDLEGLIALDCPEDEYAPEIDALTTLVLHGEPDEPSVLSLSDRI